MFSGKVLKVMIGRNETKKEVNEIIQGGRHLRKAWYHSRIDGLELLDRPVKQIFSQTIPFRKYYSYHLAITTLICSIINRSSSFFTWLDSINIYLSRGTGSQQGLQTEEHVPSGH
jgi:hypothetical protein